MVGASSELSACLGHLICMCVCVFGGMGGGCRCRATGGGAHRRRARPPAPAQSRLDRPLLARRRGQHRAARRRGYLFFLFSAFLYRQRAEIDFCFFFSVFSLFFFSLVLLLTSPHGSCHVSAKGHVIPAHHLLSADNFRGDSTRALDLMATRNARGKTALDLAVFFEFQEVARIDGDVCG